MVNFGLEKGRLQFGEGWEPSIHLQNGKLDSEVSKEAQD